MGLTLGSGSVVIALQIAAAPGYTETMSAYGIVTPVKTFTFLPLPGLTHAMQTITGNNYGSEQCQRSDAGLRSTLIAALLGL